MVEPGGSPGLLGTRNRQLLVDVNQIGLKAVSPFKGLDRGAVPAGDGSQRIAFLHGVGAGLGSGFTGGALSAAVLREDLLPAVLFRADDFLVTEGLAGGL